MRQLKLPVFVFLFIVFLLVFVQLKVENPMLLLERFFPGGGWLEILFIGFYGGLVAYNMQNPANVSKWRRYTWSLFSVVFFGQLVLGLFGNEKFLMSGKLHLPVPAMILAGPIYRGQVSVMTILFLSTILLSGPAWCSHFCYFGAIDHVLASSKKTNRSPIKNKFRIKHTLLLSLIIVTLALRLLRVNPVYATIGGITFGTIGLLIIALLSGRKGKMYHCIVYCPIGTLVNYLRFLNPFRIYIDTNCTNCLKCTTTCKYDALIKTDIENREPGFSCTLCGDCLSSCHVNSIKYKFFRLSPETSRRLYLFITISLHGCCLALARI